MRKRARYAVRFIMNSYQSQRSTEKRWRAFLCTIASICIAFAFTPQSAFASVIVQTELSNFTKQTVDSSYSGSGRPVQFRVFDPAGTVAPTTTIRSVVVWLNLLKTNVTVGDVITISLSGTIFSHTVTDTDMTLSLGASRGIPAIFLGTKNIDPSTNMYIEFTASWAGGTSTALYGSSDDNTWSTTTSQLKKSDDTSSGYFGLADVHFALCDDATCEYESPLTAFALPEPCNTTDVGCQIARGLSSLFVPSDSTVEEFYALTFASSSPFGYLYELPDIYSDIFLSTSTDFVLSIDFDDVQDDMDDIAAALGVQALARSTTTPVRIFGVCDADRSPMGAVYSTYIMPILETGVWISWLFAVLFFAYRIFNRYNEAS